MWSKLTAQGRADFPPLRWKSWENEKFGAERQVYTVLRQARFLVVRNQRESCGWRLSCARTSPELSRKGDLSPKTIYTCRDCEPQNAKSILN